MSFEFIKTDQIDRVAVVTLTRPEVLNALSLQLVTELDEFLAQAEEDDGIGAVVITGAGERAFSAGADIHENRELSEEDRDRGASKRAEYTWHLATCSKPGDRRYQRSVLWGRSGVGHELGLSDRLRKV